jgi:Excalibur calcium-binding domain
MSNVGGVASARAHDTRGQTIPEYALILAGMALLLAVSLLFLSSHISGVFHRSAPENPALRPPSATCDPDYAGACIPPPPPDLDCSDLRAMGITGEIRVVGSDPHHLDPDGDGIACD